MIYRKVQNTLIITNIWIIKKHKMHINFYKYTTAQLGGPIEYSDCISGEE